MTPKIPLSPTLALALLAGACSRAPSGEGMATTSSASVSTKDAASPSVLPDAMTSPKTDFQLKGPALATTNAHGTLETVATLEGQNPTGVAVSNDGRVFLSFPHWAEPIEYTLAELKDGALTPYPDEGVNRGLVSVESVYVDARGFLWALDTGSVNFGAVAPRAAKLVQIDPMTNKIAGTFELPGSVALPTSYLEDVRVDVARGAGGTAFISDGSPTGSNAIIVVDLAKKTSWRKLQDHPSVKADPGFVAFVEGEPVYRDPIAGGARKPLTGGVHGLALSADGKRLFYAPLASRRLYSVSTDALANENASDAEVARTIIDHGDKGASDGLETDDRDAIYAASYELNAIERRGADGTLDVVASDSRLLWPNRMAITTDGFLYVTSNQLEREPIFQGGVDHREKPYVLFRVKIDAGKVRSRP